LVLLYYFTYIDDARSNKNQVSAVNNLDPPNSDVQNSFVNVRVWKKAFLMAQSTINANLYIRKLICSQ